MVQRISELEYLKKTGWQKLVYNLGYFFKTIPQNLKYFFTVTLKAFFIKIGLSIKGVFVNIGNAAMYGDWKTRTSFGIMGFSQLSRKQFLRGLMFLAYEILFIAYMVFFGAGQLAQFGTLGTRVRGEYTLPGSDIPLYSDDGDNSFLILLYSILTIIFIIAFIYAYYQNIKSAYATQLKEEAKQHLETAKEDFASLADGQYHKTLLVIPLLGLTIFTIFPIVFSIFVAFTNYDRQHYAPANLFTWVGWKNFKALFSGAMVGGKYVEFGRVFGQVLLWTVIWAFFATFTNYILGMIVALLINKKGIRLKKLWRTVLVMTIAVPQFISLLLMSQMLGDYGIINELLQKWGITHEIIPFLTNKTIAKFTVIAVNIWVGIPYTMLMVSGILMNIPEDLYESARIDGAGPIKAYFKITLPYVIHVTTPYLITSFIGNLNNFGVIYLLTGGGPTMSAEGSGGAGDTDLLITWLYKLIQTDQAYGVASVISIIMFILTAIVSLAVYNRSNAVKNEEDFM